MCSMILKYCIESNPKFNLRDCLSHYGKSKLMDIADKQHMILNMGAPIKVEGLIKNQVVSHLAIQISMNFGGDLLYLPPRELELLTQLMETDFQATDHIDHMDCYFLHALGYVYLYNYNDHIYPIIPKELRKLYEQIPKKELVSKIKQSQRLYSYAIALTQLYGIYTVEQFIEVWNSHNDDVVEFEEVSMYFYMMYDRQNYFAYDYEYVFSSQFQNDEAYKLLDKNKDKPFCIPTKAEIERYSQEDRDTLDIKKFAKLI